MKFLILMTALIALSACQKEAETVQRVGASGVDVEKLFTFEGCSVYRFQDDRTVYFTNCSGSTQYAENCGKNCTINRQVNGDSK